MLDLYESKWLGEGYESKKSEDLARKRGQEALKNFYKKYVNEDEKPILLEQYFKLVSPGKDFVVKSFIDRVDDLGDGTVEVIDYKTGKAKDKKEVEKNEQLALYVRGVEEIFGKKVSKVSLLFVDQQKKVTVDVDMSLEKAIMSEIQDIVKQIQNAEFPPKPNSFTCGFCPYKNICKFSQV